MALTLGQAAKAAKRSKTTISRAIASGRLSAARDPAGNWAIEPVELFRAFPPAMPQEQAPERPREPLPQPSAATAMEQLVQELRARLAYKHAQIEDFRRERDRLLSIVEQREQLALPAPSRWRWWSRR